MNAIVLCEGETDQIILECLFSAEYGYKSNKEKTEERKKDGDKSCYYKNSKHELCLDVVGGHEFSNRINDILSDNKINADVFYDCIVIITDHDSGDELEIVLDRIKKVMEENEININGDMKYNEWMKMEQNIDFEESRSIEFIFIPLPLDEDGALETFLMNCLKSENEYLVVESENFVKKLINNHVEFSDKYLKRRRDKIKAPLAVFLGVTMPEKSFLKEKDLFKAVPWENYISKSDSFKKLEKLSEVYCK